MGIRRVTPAQLADSINDWLASENLVILGGPWVGKSHVFGNQASTPDCYGFNTNDGPDSLTAIEDISPPIVFDDFYTWYQSDQNHEHWQEVFAASNGVGLVTRPRRFDWLCTEKNLDSRLSNQFQIVYVQYPKTEAEVNGDYCAAIEECCKHSNYNRDIIKKNISKVYYEYSFAHEIGKYESYLPFLVYHDRLEKFDASGGVFKQVKKFGRKIKNKAFFRRLREQSTDFAVPATVGTTGISVAAYIGQPVILGLTFTLLLKLHERGSSGDPRKRVQSFLGPLADERFLPHSVSVLEEQLNFPPGSIGVLKKAVTDPELFDTLETVLEIDDEDLEELTDSVESLEDDLDDLQTEIEILSDWTEELVGDAVRDPEWLKRQNRRNRISMLREQGVSSDVAFQIASPFGEQTLRPDRLNKAVSAIEAVGDADTDGESSGVPPCLVVRGPRGIGKTSFICRLVDEISGFDAGVVDVTRDSGVIESRLTDMVGENPFLLIYKHNGASIEKIRQLLANRLVTNIDALLIEVTDSMYPDLVQAWETSPEGGHDTAAEQFEQMIERPTQVQNPVALEPLGDDYIRQLINPFDFDPKSDKSNVVVDASDGFPLLAIIAGSLVTTGDDIGQLSQQRLFVRHLENAIKKVSQETDDVERVLETLAVIRYVPDFETLFDAADVPPRNREAVERFLNRYLWGYILEADRGYRLTPEIYTRLLFQQAWFKGTSANLDSAGVGREALLADLYKEYPAGLGGCAANISGIWYHDIPYLTSNYSNKQVPQPTAVEIIQAANELLETPLSHYDPTDFEKNFLGTQTTSQEIVLGNELLRRLLAGGIPLSPDDLPVEDMFATYMIHMELQTYLAHQVDATRSDADIAEWISGQIGFRLRRWIANHLVTSLKPGLDITHRSDVEQLCAHTYAVAMELKELTDEVDPVAFVTGVYALAVLEAIDQKPAFVYSMLDWWFDVFESQLGKLGEELVNFIELEKTEFNSAENYLRNMFYTKVHEHSPEGLEARIEFRLVETVKLRARLL